MRNRVIALALVVGCYHASYEANVPCASDLSCPGAEVCDTQQSPPLCVNQLGSGDVDGGATQIDAAITACGVCPNTQPVCDASTKMCRGCDLDSDCPSHVCSESTGLCISQMQTLYVKNGGDDASTCTHDVPCASVSHAITLLDGTRNVIKIYDGVYNDSFVTSATFLLSGEGNPGGRASINYNNAHPHLIELDGGKVVVEGLGFSGGQGETVRVQGGANLTLFGVDVANSPLGSVDVVASKVTLYKTTIHDGGGTEAAILLFQSELAMSRTVMYSLGGPCVKSSSSNFDIENSILVTCGGAALEQVGTAPNPAVFSFNTIANNSTGVVCSAPIKVKSNIFAYNGMAPQLQSCASATFSLFSDTAAPGLGNIAGDPLFVANDDVHIKQGSPALDHADPTSTMVEDFDGEHRPHGAGFDIGADEHY